MHRRSELENSKIGFRDKYFTEYSTKLLTVSSGSVVVILAFIASAETTNSKSLVQLSLCLLGVSMLTQLLTSFGIYLGMGVEYDAKDESLQKFFKHFVSWCIIIGLFTLIVGAICGYLYILKNV